MLFRPEEQHGSSGEDDVVVPPPRRNSEVDDTVCPGERSVADLKHQWQVAAATPGEDSCILLEHRRDSQGVPDATCPIGALPNLDRKRRGHGPERRRSQNFIAVFLQDQCMSLGQVAVRPSDLRHLPAKSPGGLGRQRDATRLDRLPVDVQPDRPVEAA
jgi:hypothetical protein